MNIKDLIQDVLLKKNSEVVKNAISEFLILKEKGFIKEPVLDSDVKILEKFAELMDDHMIQLPITKSNGQWQLEPCLLRTMTNEINSIMELKLDINNLNTALKENSYRQYILEMYSYWEENYKRFLSQNFVDLSFNKSFVDILEKQLKEIIARNMNFYYYCNIQDILEDLKSNLLEFSPYSNTEYEHRIWREEEIIHY